MSYGPLPKRIDPRKLAERGVRIEGDASLEELPNFSSMLCNNDGKIVVDLQFDLDEQRIRTIKGSAKGHVFMT